MVKGKIISVNPQCRLMQVCQKPVIYTRGYDDNTMLSLYYYVRALYRTFHSLYPEIDLFTIGLDWNTHNYDPTGKIEQVLYKVWTEIIEADNEAHKNGRPVPFYDAPAEPVIIPVNLRCNDYMDVRLLTGDVITAVNGRLYDEPAKINTI